MMKNPIGIVQGRLLPPVNGAIQAFPSDNWKDEFLIASKVGFDMIELIFDGQNNPLFKTGQAKMVVDLVSEHNLEISSVSTDFSMYHPLFGDDGDESLITICKLIDICGKVGIDRVGLSFEDNSALLSKKDVKEDHPFPGPVLSPKSIKTLLISRYRLWQSQNLVQDDGKVTERIRVEVSKTNSSKVDIHLPIVTMGQLIISQTQIAFRT